MSSRSAEATIKGYYYQFDTSILKLLELNSNTDEIVVEGIEDVDIHTATESTAVQCKYLSKPKFTNSSLREPIILMLDHCRTNTGIPINYILYAHFEEEIGGTVKPIDLPTLKEILTFKEAKVQKYYHTDNAITDTQLNAFLAQFKLVFGKKFEDQQSEVVNRLKTHFNCSEFQADTFYYNNALRKIIDTSIVADIDLRRLSKSQFITSIDTRQKVFNEWYILLRSKKAYLQEVAKVIKATQSSRPSRSKQIIIGADVLHGNNSELTLISFIENLIHKYYNTGTSLRDAKPITLILELDDVDQAKLKEGLIKNEIPFNDGHEHIFFSSGMFNQEPIINTNKAGNKISKSSFHIRLISLSKFIGKMNEINTPKVVIHCSKNNCPYEKSTEYALFDIKHCENLKDILTIL